MFEFFLLPVGSLEARQRIVDFFLVEALANLRIEGACQYTAELIQRDQEKFGALQNPLMKLDEGMRQ